MNSFALISDIQSTFAFADSALRWLSLHVYSKHYLLLTATCYWCGFHQQAFRVAIAVCLSTLAFLLIKPFINAPRPFSLDSSVFQGIKESGSGMPSGHSQNAAVFWSLAAWSLNKKLFTAISVLIIAAIALSRIYLGVHFPSQVFVGLTIGFIIVTFWTVLEARILSTLAKLSSGTTFFICLCAALLPMIILLGSGLFVGTKTMTTTAPHQILLLTTGIAVGLAISLRLGCATKQIRPSIMLLLTRALPGLIITIFLWQLTATTPASLTSTTLIYSYCFIRGLLFTLWAVILLPSLHNWLRLPGRSPA